MKKYYVYLLANYTNRVLYVGVTNNLERRIHQHKTNSIDGFTKKYQVNKLVYFEETNSIKDAIAREKQIKGWTRKKKNEIISEINPEWKDLSSGWFT